MDGDTANTGISNSVIYDRIDKGYRFEKIYKMKLSNSEILAISKMLLESRPFTKLEMESMIECLIDCCVPKANIKLVADLIKNEEFHYIESQHNKIFIDDKDEARKDFDVLNDSFPTIYRIDRIQKLDVLEERFHIPYNSRFEEGEFNLYMVEN